MSTCRIQCSEVRILMGIAEQSLRQDAHTSGDALKEFYAKAVMHDRVANHLEAQLAALGTQRAA